MNKSVIFQLCVQVICKSYAGWRWRQPEDSGEGGQQRLVVGPKPERSTHEVSAEVFDAWVGGQQLPVKSGVDLPSFFAEETKREPVLTNLLLEDCSDMGVRGICDQREDPSRQQMD
jgi:hypothetical protein